MVLMANARNNVQILKTDKDAGPSQHSDGTTMGWSAPRLAMILLLNVALAFAIISYSAYLGLSLMSHVKSRYIEPQMDALKWTDRRERNERTYYNRDFDEHDISAFDTEDLYIEKNSTADDAYHLFLKHGFTAFPSVLSTPTAAALRNLILQKNKELDPDHHFFFHGTENRWSLDLGTEAGPELADTLEELAENKLLRSSLEKIMGRNPALVELNAITSKYGCESQSWHSDGTFDSALNYARSFSPTNVLLVQLQDTTPEMGSTQVCPGTHFVGSKGYEKIQNYCEGHSFQVAGGAGYWPTGDGVLMNTNSWHRGMEHTVDTGIHRVMLVLTFSPKPIERAESRQLTHGLSHSVMWYTVGHTLNDMARARNIMTRPWHYLRALGLYKPRDSEWGYDYVTTSLSLMTNGDFAYYSRINYEKFMEKGGYNWLPQFLRGEYREDEDEGWYEFYLDTLDRCEIFVGLVAAVSVGVYAFLLLVVNWMTNRRTSPASGPSMAKTQAKSSFTKRPQNILTAIILRLVVPFGSMYFLLLHAKSSIDKSSWAVDISSGRRHVPFFDENETGAFSGPVTLPSREDVLIETRFGYECLGMYNDFIEYHPGNQFWRRLMSENRGFLYDYKGLPAAFNHAVAWNVVKSAQAGMNSRFLYQNPSNGDWEVMSEDDAIKQTQFELVLDSRRVIRPLHTAIRFLLSDCKYGFRRDTALCASHVPPFLERLRDKVLDTPFSKNATNHNNIKGIVKLANDNKIHHTQGYRTPRPFLVPPTVNHLPETTLQRRSSLTFPRHEIDTSFLFNVGEVLEVHVDKRRDRWEKGEIVGISSGGNYKVESRQTGTYDTWSSRELRRFDTFHVGDLVEVLVDDDRWEKAEIVEITARGLYQVTFLDNGDYDTTWAFWGLRETFNLGDLVEVAVDDDRWVEAEIVANTATGIYEVNFLENADYDTSWASWELRRVKK